MKRRSTQASVGNETGGHPTIDTTLVLQVHCCRGSKPHIVWELEEARLPGGKPLDLCSKVTSMVDVDPSVKEDASATPEQPMTACLYAISWWPLFRENEATAIVERIRRPVGQQDVVSFCRLCTVPFGKARDVVHGPRLRLPRLHSHHTNTTGSKGDDKPEQADSLAVIKVDQHKGLARPTVAHLHRSRRNSTKASSGCICALCCSSLAPSHSAG